MVEASAARAADGEALARTLLVGLDGTDDEVLAKGDAADFPSGEEELVLGHECLAEIVRAPESSGFAPGERVVPLVRHPCGLCAQCARDHVDMCASGHYHEHGIKALHGFLRETWTDPPRSLVKVPRSIGDEAVLAEPLSIVVKALEVAASVQRRVPGFEGLAGKRALLAGTGSLGIMAAFLLRHEDVEVWAMDRSGADTAAARLLAHLGVRHFDAHEAPMEEIAERAGGFDLVVEGTGSAQVALETALALRENGISVLLGVPGEKPPVEVDADDVMRAIVLKNLALVGSVNSSRHHLEIALQRLGELRARWPDELARVVTHRFAPQDAVEAFEMDDKSVVKKVVDWR